MAIAAQRNRDGRQTARCPAPWLTSATTETFTIEVSDSSSPQLTAAQDYTVRVGIEHHDDRARRLRPAASRTATSSSFAAGCRRTSGRCSPACCPTGLTGPDAATASISGTPVAACSAADHEPDGRRLSTTTRRRRRIRRRASISPSTRDARRHHRGTRRWPHQRGLQPAVSRSTGGVPPYNFAVTGGEPPEPALPECEHRPHHRHARHDRDAGLRSDGDRQLPEHPPRRTSASRSITPRSAATTRSRTRPLLPGDGSYAASISPSGDPNTVFDPDEDYYAITTTATRPSRSTSTPSSTAARSTP